MKIRPATRGDADAVVTLLHQRMNSKIAPDRWRRLFTYDWLDVVPDYGRVAEADGEIVGYVGAIYSDRMIAGRTERLVNICAWYLSKDHRGGGAGTELMAQATDNPEWHYNIMTSSSRTVGILDDVGYRVLDDHRYDWHRTPGSDGPLGAVFDAVTDRDEIVAAATDTELKLLKDHAGLPVTPVLLCTPTQEALALFSFTRKGDDQPWYDLLYIRDPSILSVWGQATADALLPADNAVMSADARFCQPPPNLDADTDGRARRISLPVPRFVKSQRLSGHYVDHLYTELQLMGLKLD